MKALASYQCDPACSIIPAPYHQLRSQGLFPGLWAGRLFPPRPQVWEKPLKTRRLRYHKWVKFVFWFSTCLRALGSFLRALQFTSLLKNSVSSVNCNPTRAEDSHENRLRLKWLSCMPFLFLFCFIIPQREFHLIVCAFCSQFTLITDVFDLLVTIRLLIT